MKLALCQFDMKWEDKESNHRIVREMVDSAGLEPGSLLLLPEMFATGFSTNVDAIAERENGPSTRFLQELATDLGIHVLGGVATVGSDGRGRNEAVAFSPDGAEQARYTKIQPFMGGEARSYTGGEEIVSLSRRRMQHRAGRWGDPCTT